MILRVSPGHRSRLLQWFDKEVFDKPNIPASGISDSTQNVGYGDVDDLIDQLNGVGADVTSSIPSSSLSAPPGLATAPSSPTSNVAIEDVRTVPNTEHVFELSTDSEAPQPNRGRRRGMRARGRCAQSTRTRKK